MQRRRADPRLPAEAPRASDPTGWRARLVWLALLALATSPAWQLLVLGAAPTLDELLRLRCAPR